MTPATTKDAPESPANGAAWLSVAQASAALNVSEKTLLRRIKAGKFKAEKAPLPAGGVAWRVRLDSQRDSAMDNGKDTERTIVPEPQRTKNEREASGIDSVPEPERTIAPEVFFPRAGTAKDNASAELLAHLKSENLFLRGLVEQRDRDAAELRAALRKALDNAPRQLTQGNAQQSQNAPAAPAKRPATPATTPTQNDDLNEDEIDELCRRFFEAKL